MSSDLPVLPVTQIVKRGRGRPKKAEIEKYKGKGKAPVPRVPGMEARLRELHARLMATSGDRIIQTVIHKALNEKDKDQAVCLRMCMDRLLPISYFEDNIKSKGGQVTINIVGVGDVKPVIEMESDG